VALGATGSEGGATGSDGCGRGAWLGASVDGEGDVSTMGAFVVSGGLEIQTTGLPSYVPATTKRSSRVTTDVAAAPG